MRQLVAGGELGTLALITANAYTDFLYRPRRPEELVTEQGGGIMYNQVPHQVDAVRFLAGGVARTVRASTWSLDPARPTEGCYAAFLTFEAARSRRWCTAATITWTPVSWPPGASAPNRGGTGPPGVRSRGCTPHRRRWSSVVKSGYSSSRPGKDNGKPVSLLQPELGIFVATCANADLRLVPEGVAIYSSEGLQVIAAEPPQGEPGRGAVLDELYAAVNGERPAVHDGRWAKATMEVCLAMRESAREQREVPLRHQTASATPSRADNDLLNAASAGHADGRSVAVVLDPLLVELGGRGRRQSGACPLAWRRPDRLPRYPPARSADTEQLPAPRRVAVLRSQ